MGNEGLHDYSPDRTVRIGLLYLLSFGRFGGKFQITSCAPIFVWYILNIGGRVWVTYMESFFILYGAWSSCIFSIISISISSYSILSRYLLGCSGK